jgi:hypothetical protein
MTDFTGVIGTLEFVTGEVAFSEAAKAQREGHFGKTKPGEPSQKEVLEDKAPAKSKEVSKRSR